MPKNFEIYVTILHHQHTILGQIPIVKHLTWHTYCSASVLTLLSCHVISFFFLFWLYMTPTVICDIWLYITPVVICDFWLCSHIWRTTFPKYYCIIRSWQSSNNCFSCLYIWWKWEICLRFDVALICLHILHTTFPFLNSNDQRLETDRVFISISGVREFNS